MEGGEVPRGIQQEMKMNRRWGVALAGAILLTAPTWGQTDAGGGYHGPALGHAGDVTYPMNSSTTGIVTLDISVDATGTVQNVGVVRDVPPLTSAAQIPSKAIPIPRLTTIALLIPAPI